MKVKLSCQPLTWSRFEEALSDIAQIGYDGIEVPVATYLDRLDEIQSALTRHRLACSATYVSGAFWKGWDQEADLAVRVAQALPRLGCQILILASSGYQPRPEPAPKEHYQRFCETVNEIAKKAKEFGVKTVFHNHAWTLIESPEEIDLLMENTDPELVWAGFDTAQLAYGGADPATTFRKYAHRIGYLHIKDLNPSLKGLTLQQRYEKGLIPHVFWELGRGAIGDEGLVAVLDVLREIDYNGWITAELDSTPLTPRIGNGNNYMWLVEHLKPGERAQLTEGLSR
ncbi:MAG: sugar phosphate isomerase/epimerase [Armatimonadetes bacterium]|nr:sugar phosphate isomerase/epimerase [Armatimonadota bacterium]MDW8122471.1 sugar phosphate isomerase/epimerase [Armatimonadota bacterium]